MPDLHLAKSERQLLLTFVIIHVFIYCHSLNGRNTYQTESLIDSRSVSVIYLHLKAKRPIVKCQQAACLVLFLTNEYNLGAN